MRNRTIAKPTITRNRLRDFEWFYDVRYSNRYAAFTPQTAILNGDPAATA
jgi:hypothetical protein